MLKAADYTIPPNATLIQYSGRVDFSNPQAPRFDWPGCSVTASFRGTNIGFLLADGKNNFEVYADGKPITVWSTLPNQELYTVENLEPGIHVVKIVKRTEASFGVTTFKGVVLWGEEGLMRPPERASRRIEFIGDSIVCGYGDEGDSVKCPDLRPYENVEKAFSGQTAQDLDAEYHVVAFSGKGLIRHWGDKLKRSTDPFAPLYERTLGSDPKSRWNFSSWIPDAVVVHLGNNDFSTEPKADPADYMGAYTALLKRIRKTYPNAALFCFAPTGWPNFNPFVEQVVAGLNASGDAKVCFVGYPNASQEELGCDSHPNATAQRKIADILTPAIKKALNW